MHRFVLSMAFIFTMIASACGGTISFNPSTPLSVSVGDMIELPVMYDQAGDADPVLGFDLLLSSSNTGVFSVVSTSIQTPPFDPVMGALGNFSGLALTGQTGVFQLGTVKLLAAGPGDATLSFQYPTSQYGILLDGEFATNVVSPTLNVNVRVPEPGTLAIAIGSVFLLLGRSRRF